MIKTTFILLEILFYVSMSKAANINSINDIEPGFECGVSGAFTGIANGLIIQAGGCNFPENPLGDKSQKRFYKGIYNIKETNLGYETELLGYLPHELAYGASVSIPNNGMILIGGNDSNRNYNDVYLLKIKDQHEIELSDLPSLPFFMDNFGAAYSKGIVYVGGGNKNGEPSNSLIMLDLSNLEKGWQELPDFPGSPRVQPVMAVVKDSLDQEFVCIWGGFAAKGENREASLNTDGLRFNVVSNKWERTEGPYNTQGDEVSVSGGCSLALSDGKIIVTGGVNKDIFLEALQNQPPDYLFHPISWYKLNPYIFIFNPIDSSWNILGCTSGSARAGAGMVRDENSGIWVLGGELKPRIRTAEVFKFFLP